MARIVMFVLNDVRRDARVLREAGSLAAAGHAVTVIGRPADPAATVAERDVRDGFDIQRIPVPGRWRRALLAAGGGRGSASAPTAVPEAPRSGLGVAARLVVGTVRRLATVPGIRSVARGLDMLVRWRFGVMAWGTAAAAAAPVADVWHAHDLTGLPAAEAARARHGGRLVYDAHELYTDAGDTATRPRWARRVLLRYERRAIRQADAVVTVNEDLATELGRLAPVRRMVVVHNTPALTQGGSAAARSLSPLRAAAGVAPDAPLALYHGSFAAGRGVEVLAAALGEPGMEQVHAVFLGEGVGGPALRATAAEALFSGRLHVLPPVDPSILTRWVAGADVGVMPIAPTTRNHRLSTPNKLFECLAAGVPVIASDFPGIRRVVEGSPGGPLGVLVDPTDPAAVAQAILRVVTAPESERRALRERCRRAARTRWNWDVESQGLIALYADLAPARAAMAAPPPAVGEPGSSALGAAPDGRSRIDSQRVTFVLPTSGAFDARTRRMAIALGARGHDVLVIARSEAGLPDREVPGTGVVLRRINAGSAPPTAVTVGSGPASVVSNLVRMAKTARRTRSQARAARTVDRPATLYHAMGFLALPVAIDLAGAAAAPFVYDARDLYAEGNNIARLPTPLRAIFARRERSWARRAAAVLTVNESLADELERRLGVARPTVILNVQVPYAPPDPRPDHLRTALGLPAGTRIVLYHGGFMRDRGLPETIAAMRTPGLEAAHLVLMGSGVLEPTLSALAADPGLGGRVHLLPPVLPADLLDWVASADVGVMPNQPATFNERLSTPNKLFECLAAGTPVVSSDFPARRRIVIDDPDGPLGAVCDPTDPASIGRALRSLLDLDDRAAADLRARCLRATAARYDWDGQFQRLLETYERVTGARW